MANKFSDLYIGKELQERLSIQERHSSFDLKEWLKFLYNFEPSDTALDLGCGNGKDLLYFANLFKKGIGVDSSARLIENARNSQGMSGITNLDFINEDCNDYCADGMKFGKIFSAFAFYYFDEKKVTDNIIKMLAPQGSVFIAGSPDENAPELMELVAELLAKEEVPATYKEGFSDVRKYHELFKSYFRFVQFYRFVNVVRFPNAKFFIEYLENTTLAQSLDAVKRNYFLNESTKIQMKKGNCNLTKIVDVLRASNK